MNTCIYIKTDDILLLVKHKVKYKSGIDDLYFTYIYKYRHIPGTDRRSNHHQKVLWNNQQLQKFEIFESMEQID